MRWPMNLWVTFGSAALAAYLLLLPPAARAVGGDDCATSTVITAVPYTDQGNTCSFTNWYDEHCPAHSASPEEVYTYTPASDQCVDVSLCGGTGFDSKLYVYASDAGGCPPPASDNTGLQIACNDDACPTPADPVSEITGLQLLAGVGYWFVVDGSFDECGDYQIDIVPCLPQSCVCDTDCDDGNPCSDEACCEGACSNPLFPDGFPCDDGDACTVGDTCADGACTGTPVDCSPWGDDCNAGVCNQQTGACEAIPDNEGGPCGSGLFCTQGGLCVMGACTGGTSPDCDDADPCTDDACDEVNDVCAHIPIPGCCVTDSDCDDGVFCNGQEFCDPTLTCQAGTPPEGAACEDGLFCTIGETCAAGVCGGGAPRSCDDGDSCTTDSCDEEEGVCRHKPIEPCCGQDEDCDDGNPCTDNFCNMGICENPPAPAGTPCASQSNTDCTDPDTCDTTGTCQPNDAPDGTPCDDNDLCTDNDACFDGVCAGMLSGLCGTCSQEGNPGDPVNQLSFQALLKDSTGNPVQGPVDLTFQFYDLTGNAVGSPVTMMSVPVTDGIVSTPIPIQETIFDGTGRELGVSVNGTLELAPRLPVASAPQSFRVNCAAGQEIVDDLELGDSERNGALRIVGPSPVAGRGHPVWDFVTVQTKSTTLGDCGQALLMDEVDTTVDLSGCGTGTILGADYPLGGILRLYNATDYHNTVSLLAGGPTIGVPSQLRLRDQAAEDRVRIFSSGLMQMINSAGALQIQLDDSSGGQLTLNQLSASVGVRVDGDNAGNGGKVEVRNASNEEAVVVHASHNNAGQIVLKNQLGEDRLFLEAAHTGDEGALLALRNGDGNDTIVLDAGIGNTSGILLKRHWDGSSAITLSTEFGGVGGPAAIVLTQTDGDPAINISAEYGGAGGGADLRLYDDGDNATIILDADAGGLGWVTTDVLEIKGGSDLSERFDIGATQGPVEPGMVVSIDPQRPGQLVVSTKAYDQTVAGIISGAGGLKPGMLMGQSASVADGAHPVALSGRAYCWADASNGPIRPGDLLTTSGTPGHAMKVTDHARAQGAIIGKAMTPLKEGTGLVLLLVSLQ